MHKLVKETHVMQSSHLNVLS